VKRAIALSMLVLTAFAAGAAEPPWKTETWPAARKLVWAKPGEGGSMNDATSWLENGKPATKPPDKDTDVELPDANSFYKVGGGRGKAVRHCMVGRNAMIVGGHRGEMEVWGNCHVKDGGRVYFLSIRGPKHTYFRIDNAEFPGPKNKAGYGHVGRGASDPENRTQISHKFQVCKYGDASVEFIGNFGVSDEIMVQHGRLILSGNLRWSGVTGKGALEIYDGGILELQSGATAAPFKSGNGKSVYNIDIYRNGTLRAGSPDRPITSDCYLMLGYGDSTRAGKTGLYAAAGSRIRVYSADPRKARLVITSITSDPDFRNAGGRSVGNPETPAKGTEGISMRLAGDVQLDGVLFDYVAREGIRLADTSVRGDWSNIQYGPHNAAKGDDLFGKLDVNPNVYYHKRGDAQSEFGLTIKAVRSMEEFMEEEDPYKVAFAPPAAQVDRRDKIRRPMPIVYGKPISVTMKMRAKDAALHYTLDGTQPTPQSLRYAGPIKLSETTTIKVRAFRNGRQAGATYTETYVFRGGE